MGMVWVAGQSAGRGKLLLIKRPLGFGLVLSAGWVISQFLRNLSARAGMAAMLR